MPLTVPEVPRGLPIGTYPTYLKAQEAVDYLSDHQFAVENVSIIGSDLRLVEQVTGRLTRGRVISAAAGSGALWGLFMGSLILLFAGNDVSIVVPIVATIIGALVGAVSGLLAYAATGGKRDFTSNTGVVATSYEVVCDPRSAEEARNLLGQLALRDG